MMDLVDQTLREWRTSDFAYGQTDCMLSVGRYLARAGRKDVTGLFVGRYDTQEGALVMMAEHGGAGALIAATGATPVDGRPQRGDVLALVYGEDTIGALCTGGMVAARLDRGIVEVSLRLVKWRGAWRP